jgi:hypothetical protein
MAVQLITLQLVLNHQQGLTKRPIVLGASGSAQSRKKPTEEIDSGYIYHVHETHDEHRILLAQPLPFSSSASI